VNEVHLALREKSYVNLNLNAMKKTLYSHFHSNFSGRKLWRGKNALKFGALITREDLQSERKRERELREKRKSAQISADLPRCMQLTSLSPAACVRSNEKSFNLTPAR
jgi:hypothetical protein